MENYTTVVTFLEFYEQVEDQGIVVYHGSRRDFEKIQGGPPPYKGGIGIGVYVSILKKTAEFYGECVYKLKTKFNWDQIFSIRPENGVPDNNSSPIIDFESDSDTLVVGEQIPPFGFILKGQRYSVTRNGFMGRDESWESKGLDKLSEMLDDWEYFPAIAKTFQAYYDRGKFPRVEDFKNDIEAYIANRNPQWGGKTYLPGEVGQMARKQHGEDRQHQQYEIEGELEGMIERARKQSDIGIEIDMEDIGDVVQEAGFRAVYVEGIRHGATVNEEMLVFNEDDLVILGKEYCKK